MFRATLLLALAFATLAAIQGPESPGVYKARIADWRKNQEADIMKADGWLAVAGLFWLEEGDNSIGSGPNNKIVLPKGSTTMNLGVVNLHNGVVTLTAAKDAVVALNGSPITSVVMESDSTRVRTGDLALVVIKRGNRIGIRLFDFDSRGRREFAGMKWFPIDPAYRVKAKYVSYDTPRTMSITNVLGDTAPVPNPGYVEFAIDGRVCRLEAQSQGGGLFFNFRDVTSGHETYAAGRFLDAPAPKDGLVDLDFNQATNPPCAFTQFATCPLPPKENILAIPIRAGEKVHHPVSD